MAGEHSQGMWAPGGATVRFPVGKRLAPAERDRLWKGLERFVNCGDSKQDYQALGHGFPRFWPLNLQDTQGKSLAWTDTCHSLFLVYRDVLRRVWASEKSAVLGGHSVPFLLGIGSEFDAIGNGVSIGIPKLSEAWQKIQEAWPGIFLSSKALAWPDWISGNFVYYAQSEFHLALYSLFRESWRARTCPRCNLQFVARKPKQIFCGTVCSAGSRLATKREWWSRVGAKRRAKQKRSGKGNRKEGKRR